MNVTGVYMMFHSFAMDDLSQNTTVPLALARMGAIWGDVFVVELAPEEWGEHGWAAYRSRRWRYAGRGENKVNRSKLVISGGVRQAFCCSVHERSSMAGPDRPLESIKLPRQLAGTANGGTSRLSASHPIHLDPLRCTDVL
jgi:hypothetical protein